MNKPEHPPSRKGGYPQEFREEAVRYWLSLNKTGQSKTSLITSPHNQGKISEEWECGKVYLPRPQKQ